MNRVVLELNGTPREYLLRSPRRAGASLVLFLHGTGATAEWADGETGWSAQAEREDFALAIPQALTPDPSQPPKFLTNPARWNDGKPSNADVGTRNAEPPTTQNSADIPFLATVMDDVLARTQADSQRVFVTGFSNGAAMTFRLAAELADRIAGIAPVAGYCWIPDPKPSRPVPTLYMIGAADPLVPLRGGEVRNPWLHRYVRRPPITETLERWATAIGCNPAPKIETETDSVRVDTYPGAVPFHVMTINGLGHHWAGGRGEFNHRIAGPPSDAINATEVVWDFFHNLPPANGLA